MNIKRNIPVFPAVAVLLFSLLLSTAKAQEVDNEFQLRTEFKATYKPTKKLKISLNPELRFDETFTVDKYHIEGIASYKVFKFLSVDAGYRFIGNPRDGKTTQYFNSYLLGFSAKKSFDRFQSSIRVRYTNYADDEITDKKFLRYKGELEYNIKGCKITPFVAVEAFQQLSDNALYKMRYVAGAEYKIVKNNYIGINYKLDYYLLEAVNRHIINLSYKINF